MHRILAARLSPPAILRAIPFRNAINRSLCTSLRLASNSDASDGSSPAQQRRAEVPFASVKEPEAIDGTPRSSPDTHENSDYAKLYHAIERTRKDGLALQANLNELKTLVVEVKRTAQTAIDEVKKMQEPSQPVVAEETLTVFSLTDRIQHLRQDLNALYMQLYPGKPLAPNFVNELIFGTLAAELKTTEREKKAVKKRRSKKTRKLVYRARNLEIKRQVLIESKLPRIGPLRKPQLNPFLPRKDDHFRRITPNSDTEESQGMSKGDIEAKVQQDQGTKHTEEKEDSLTGKENRVLREQIEALVREGQQGGR
ncbi:hypothetical protein QBC42DRAFT_274387 [Cladorrhinum samala]|uniref:Uncharacterized protein n=1 Tax=Cladorrhinum samala TaxID=585594 RepID=A0AAV9HHZ5_9PEZI|nr:hypothetical protein QBC42DRAFT_274387 [Cladorrhinum samala]